MVKGLETELLMGHDRMQQLNAEIDRLKRQELGDNAQMHDIAIVTGRLRVERDDLMQKLQHLNITYDNCV